MPHTNEALLPYGVPTPGTEVAMHAYAMRHAPAAFIWKAGSFLQRSARSLDAWLAARAKSREDSYSLEAMSDRELRDIGIDPARIHQASWVKDWSI